MNYESIFMETMSKAEFMNFVEKKRSMVTESEAIEFDGVKITPPFVEFVDTREGQVYEKVITIMNFGNRNAFIRLENPKSFAFTIKPFIRGQNLSPGLCIKRKITYMYSKVSIIPYAEIPIYINNKLYLYPMFITSLDVEIAVIPSEIDFGVINAECLSRIETVTVKNLCGRAVRFSVDLHKCQDSITVEPSRGIFKPKETATLSVQLMSGEPGLSEYQFWIKCQKPVCVKIRANVLAPYFQILHPLPANEVITLMDFGKTYFGTTVSRTMVVRNFSAFRTMFCTTVNIEGHDTVLRKAAFLCPDITVFHFTPSSGRFLPFEDKTITIQFKSSKQSYEENHIVTKKYFNWYRLTQVDFQDLTNTKAKAPDDFAPYKRDSTELKSPGYYMSSTSLTSTVGPFGFSIGSGSLLDEKKTGFALRENILYSFLYGEVHTPQVTVVPSEITLTDLNLKDVIIRTINLKNENKHLPIFFEYKTVAFIQLEPQKGKIKPEGNIDLLIKIIAAVPGKIQKKIAFDLLYVHNPEFRDKKMEVVGQTEMTIRFEVNLPSNKPKPIINHGIHPKISNEVGFLPEEVTYKSNITIPQPIVVDRIREYDKRSDVIAFPNDMPKSLRPRRNLTKRCTTIFSKLPRIVANWDDYDLTEKQKAAKDYTQSYFNNYFKAKREILEKKRQNAIIERKKVNADVPFYDITDKKHLLLLDNPKENCELISKTQNTPHICYVPMDPEELYNVKIIPNKIVLKGVLVESRVLEKITVKNLNDFPLSVCVEPLKNYFYIIGGERRLLKANSEIVIELMFLAPAKPERVFVLIEILINDNHFARINFTAQVVQTTVMVDTMEVVFQNEDRYKVVTLTNMVSSDALFQWKLNSECFRIVPMSGKIPAHKHLKCSIYKQICDNTCFNTEAELNFDCSPYSKTISLNVSFSDFKAVLIENQLDVLVPLNRRIRKFVTLRNLDMNCVTFLIIDSDKIPGLTVYPTSGLLRSRTDEIIKIEFYFEAIVQLSTVLVIRVGNQSDLKLKVNANVVYPQYHIIPNMIHFKKLACFATEVVSFVLENKCSVKSKFQFPMKDFGYYLIKETDEITGRNISEDGMFLNPGESKRLFLFFTPKSVSTVKFYLPIVVNDIMGPVTLNISRTRQSIYFIEDKSEPYESTSDIKVIKPNTALPSLMVASMVTGIILNFSKIFFKFYDYPSDSAFDSKTDELIITNVTDTEQELCIRTDDIKNDFYFEFKDDDGLEIYENSMSAILEPEQKIEIKIFCKSKLKQSFDSYAPVYLRNYEKGPFFTYLRFQYVYHAAIISTEDEIVFFPPVPLYSTVGKTVMVTLLNHSKDCVLNIETNSNIIHASFGERTRPSETEEVIPLRIAINFKSTISLFTTITLSCSCDAFYQLGVKGCSENCLFTIHAFRKIYLDPLNEEIKRSQSNIRTMESLNDEPYCEYSGRRFFIKDYCYPFFPRISSQNKYAMHMNLYVRIMEGILFTQCFNREINLKIPEGLASMPLKTKKRKGEKKKLSSNLLYFEQIAINLFGKNFAHSWCSKRQIPENNIERVAYVFDSHDRWIKLLKSHGGLLTYVSPEYLLLYEDYYTLLNDIIPNKREAYNLELKKPYNEENFYYRSKQCWLDIILQSFKSLILFKIDTVCRFPEPYQQNSEEIETESVSQSNRNKSDTISNSEIEERTIQEDYSEADVEFKEQISIENTESDIFTQILPTPEETIQEEDPLVTKSELLILQWLEKCYNFQIENLWKSKPDGHLLKERKVIDIQGDLDDCLVILATISLYCPFFDDRIEDIYFDVESPEKKQHNAIILLKWLDKIHGIISLTPEDFICTRTRLFMLMLTCYLYSFLPSLYPKKSLSMEADINKTSSRNIIVQNNDKETVSYTVRLFNNRLNCFTISHELFSVPSKKTFTLKVTFEAKLTKSIKAYILLNGENQGFRFAKSTPYRLDGLTKFNQCTTTVTLSVPVYDSVDVSLPIQSPYISATTYRLYCSVGKPENSNEVKLISWKSKKLLPALPSRISSDVEELTCDENGRGILNFRAYIFTETRRLYTIFFINSEVGDFCIELRILPDSKQIPHSNIQIEIDNIRLQKNIFGKCTCNAHSVIGSKKHRCPKLLRVLIPNQNDQLWKSVGKLFKIVIPGYQFWKDDYVTTSHLGANIVYFALNNVKEECRQDIIHLYKENCNYSVVVQSKLVTMPQKITINGVRKIKENVEVFMHLNTSNVEKLKNFTFVMTSEDLLEKRYYDVVWNLPPEAINLVKSFIPMEITSTSEINEENSNIS